MATAREALRADRGARVTDTGRLREALIAVAFLTPSLVIFVAFFFYPFQQVVLRGLYRNNSAGTRLRYVGWSQYGDVLSGPQFREGLEREAHALLKTLR